MAIKRINPNATFKIVSQQDSAIDHESAEELIVKGVDGKPDSVKAARWEKYLESFELSDLKFKQDEKPDYFIVRCLKATERAELNQKYQVVDVINKRVHIKDQNQMMLDIFEKACLGIESEDGKPLKVSVDEVGYDVAVEVGSIISLMSTLGKNLKKP